LEEFGPDAKQLWQYDIEAMIDYISSGAPTRQMLKPEKPTNS
jgi:hypothetical protein